MAASGRNIASRAARWSADHRKAAILGWIAFVVLAFGVGQAVTQEKLTNAQSTAGEAGRAERALDEAGLRPNSEVVLVQSETQTVANPGFRRTIAEVTGVL